MGVFNAVRKRIEPQSGAIITGILDPIQIKAKVSTGSSLVVKVEFFANGHWIGEDTIGGDGWSIDDWRCSTLSFVLDRPTAVC